MPRRQDITYKIIPDADFKFYITANVRTRAYRRYKELKTLNRKITFSEVLKVLKWIIVTLTGKYPAKENKRFTID